MSEMPGMTAWQRVGDALRRRRESLEPRWANLALFAQECNVNYRVLWDIEHGARDNFRRQTLRQIEDAYQVPPGWIAQALANGGEPPAIFEGPDPLDALRPSATAWELEQAARFIKLIRESRKAQEEQENSERRRPA